MYLIGLDFGSTNIKGLLFDENGQILGRISRPTPTAYLPNGYAEYHPEEIFGLVFTVLKELVGDFSRKKDIKALSFASMGEAGVPLDRNLKPLAPSIAWFCQRTIGVARRIAQKMDPFDIYRITGMQVSHWPSLCKIVWERENLPDVHRQTHRWAFLSSYLVYCLTGELKTDPSLACRSMAFDIRSGTWSETMCGLEDIDPGIFPPVIETGSPVGCLLPEIADELGLDRSVAVVQGGHDHPCGALSTGLEARGKLLNSSGTVDNALTLIDPGQIDRSLFEMGFFCGNYLISGTFYTQGGLAAAGLCVDWFANSFYRQDNEDPGRRYSIMIKEAEEVPLGSKGVIFMPHLRGSLVHKNPGARGCFLGLKDIHTRGHLARAVFEGLALEYRIVIEQLKNVLGETFEEVFCFGGGSQNRFWVQTKADVWNRPVKVYKTRENTCLGAAILAGMGSGVYRNRAHAWDSMQNEVETVTPDPVRSKEYEFLYRDVYVSIYRHKKEIDTLIEKQLGH